MENERREFLKALDFGSHTGEFHKSLIDAIERASKPELKDLVVLKPRSNGPTERISFHIMGMGANMPSIFHQQIENRLIRDGMVGMDPVVIIIDDNDSEDRIEEMKKIISEKGFTHDYTMGVPPFISLMDRIKAGSFNIDEIAVAKASDEPQSFDPPKNYLFTEPPRQKKSRNRPDKITIARMNKRKKKR